MNAPQSFPPHPSAPRSSRVFLILLLGAGCLGGFFLVRSPRPTVTPGTQENLQNRTPPAEPSARDVAASSEDTVTFSPVANLSAGTQSTNVLPQSAAVPGRSVAA